MKVFVLFLFYVIEKACMLKNIHAFFYNISFLKSSSLPLNTVMWRYSPLS